MRITDIDKPWKNRRAAYVATVALCIVLGTAWAIGKYVYGVDLADKLLRAIGGGL